MEGLVFVPGIFGSELYFHPEGGGPPELIWPPGPDDLNGYLSIDELVDPRRVSVGDVVDTAFGLCYPVYEPIEGVLRAIADNLNDSAPGTYLAVPYDWRKNLFDGAAELERAVTQWADGSGFESIAFFSHSMGGLVTRLLLENILPSRPPADRPAWLPLVKRAVFACTPHLGAPKSLSNALGLEGDETLTADQLRRVMEDTNFPSGFQLMPSPSRDILYDTPKGKYVPYDRADVAKGLGLSLENLAKGAAARTALDAFAKPRAVDYYFMYGSGLATDVSIAIDGLSTHGASPRQNVAGDGTVPSWSITEAAAQFAPPVPTWGGAGEHLAILSTEPFEKALRAYFGVAAAAAFAAVASPEIYVHCDRTQYAPGQPIQALLTLARPANALRGALSFQRLQPDGSLAATSAAGTPVSMTDGSFDHTSVQIPAPTEPGAYRLVFGGEGATHRHREMAGSGFLVR
jgi:hypothetical protein